MRELIAKRYVEALYKSLDEKSIENTAEIFASLASALTDVKVATVINAPQVSKEQKEEILLSAVKGAKSKEINNLLKLIVDHGRIEIIPDIANELKKKIATAKREFSGVVYSDSEIGSKVLTQLGDGLSKKFDAKISLSYKQSDFDGIKVDVEDLGVEISFSKSRINKQIVEHILKAI